MPEGGLLRAMGMLLYGAAGQLARGAAALSPSPSPAARGGKLRQVLAARRGIRSRYAAWGAADRDPDRQLLWMHAPSVGEGLQARPVLQLARERRPELQLAYTYFSPSAASFAAGLAVDFADYLPFDTAGDARAALGALNPDALVFSKLDVWPTLVAEASRRGIPLGMVSATLAQGSSRRRGPAARLLRAAYARLDMVGAIDEEDAERLVALGVRAGVIQVTGDTRYDQVWARARAAALDGPLLSPLASGRPTLVAGSTWPADEAPLLRAWREVRRAVPEARLVIAPHEPTPAHLAPVERWAADAGLRLSRLGQADSDSDVVLVDRVGVLGDLYALADVAYVGGGFHAAGLHSVLEPAAYGAPVLFGPRWQASRDAALLQRAGGGVSAADADALARAAIAWVADSGGARAAAGSAALEVVRGGLGAAERSYQLVSSLLAR